MAAGGYEIDARTLGPLLRLWAEQATVDALERFLAEQLPLEYGPLLSFYGSGDFHHVSALLIARAAATGGRPLTVIHIDNHPDWVRFRRGMHCGSWVGRAARLPQIDRVITVGPCSADIDHAWRKGGDLSLVRDGRVELYPYGADGKLDHKVQGVVRPTIAGLGEDAFLDLLAGRIGTDDIYVTIDKDALAIGDAATNWGSRATQPGVCRGTPRAPGELLADRRRRHLRRLVSPRIWRRCDDTLPQTRRGMARSTTPCAACRRASAQPTQQPGIACALCGSCRMIGLLLVAICVVTETARDLCFKRAAEPLGPALASRNWCAALTSGALLAGLGFWAVEMLLWVLTLQHLPLGIAFPLMALSYAAVPLAARLLLHEQLGRTQLSGILLITAGAVCVGFTGL